MRLPSIMWRSFPGTRKEITSYFERVALEFFFFFPEGRKSGVCNIPLPIRGSVDV